MIPDSLQQYIEQTILPQYDAFDGGHRRDHAQTVIDESLKLAREHGADEQMAYTIAAYHDLGLRYDRDTHHIHSGKILLADERLREWFTEEQLLVMRDAVEDHRASSKNPPRTIYGAIVAEADRQIDPETVIRRTMAYSKKLLPEAVLRRFISGVTNICWRNTPKADTCICGSTANAMCRGLRTCVLSSATRRVFASYAESGTTKM